MLPGLPPPVPVIEQAGPNLYYEERFVATSKGYDTSSGHYNVYLVSTKPVLGAHNPMMIGGSQSSVSLSGLGQRDADEFELGHEYKIKFERVP